MKDRLSKKRIRCDYEYFIRVLGLYGEFVIYCKNIRPLLSKRRYQYNFLRKKKVLLPELYYFCKFYSVYDYSDLIIKSGNREDYFYGV